MDRWVTLAARGAISTSREAILVAREATLASRALPASKVKIYWARCSLQRLDGIQLMMTYSTLYFRLIDFSQIVMVMLLLLRQMMMVVLMRILRLLIVVMK